MIGQIEKLEKDLESVAKAIEQGMANCNTLIGQRQGLEHAIKILKEAGTPVAPAESAIPQETPVLEGEIVN